MKISAAGFHGAESGAKNGKAHHNTTAPIEREMKEPVIALDSTKPRRMRICAIEKHSAA